MSIYGYGYGDNSGENLIDWNYYRNPPQQQQPGLQPRPLDYPAHLPWPPPASLGGGSSDYESPPAPKDNRDGWDKWYDYVDEGKFGVADRTLSRGLQGLPLAGSVLWNATEKDMGIPNNNTGIGGFIMGPMGHQAENYLSANPANQYGASYRGPGYRITSKDPSLTEEQRNRTNNMMLGIAPGQDITDSRRNMGMTREVGDYLNSLNSYQAAQNELENTPMSALQGKAEAWKGSLEAERQQANIDKSISEVQSLQEQVDKAKQAKGITTLAQEKDIFGSPNIGNPGRGFTQPTDLTQQNLGIQGVDQSIGQTPNVNPYEFSTVTETFTPDNNYGYGGSQVDSAGNSSNYGWSGGSHGDGSTGQDASGGFGGFEDGTDESDAASADQGYW